MIFRVRRPYQFRPRQKNGHMDHYTVLDIQYIKVFQMYTS